MKIIKIVITSSFGGLGTINDCYSDKLTITETSVDYEIKYTIPKGLTSITKQKFGFETESKEFSSKFNALCSNFEEEAKDAQELFFCDAFPSKIKLYYDNGEKTVFDYLPEILSNIKKDAEFMHSIIDVNSIIDNLINITES